MNSNVPPSVPTERWQRMQQLFTAALEMPPEFALEAVRPVLTAS